MPTYGENNFKESNVNYLNKDFQALKTSLMNYAKSYFPDSYRDFNETSPGMMLLEMNAYVGDVLSFYVDQQYREMLLPLAEERRNIINLAKMFGYKVKPIVPSYVDLTFTSDVEADTDKTKVNYNHAGVFDAGMELVSSTNSDIVFTTLEPVDFKITGSNDTETIGTSTDGLVDRYTLSRTVRAVSATEKTLTFQIGTPEKFRKIVIPDTNVVDIVSCVDSNGQNWYEVDFLAQDKVPIPLHYTDDVNRNSAYTSDGSGLISSTAVPYSLTYITTTKRFTRETNEDNTTSLVFGNGVLKNGEVVDSGFIDLEQIGITIPGQYGDLNDSIDPMLGNEYSTLGETPNQTTLTITYRVGGGVNSNVPSGDLTTLPSPAPTPTLGTSVLSTVTNNSPARGGKDQEPTLEIREKAKAFFSTQNRCVTKEDYEARVVNIPAKFGNIAKAYVARNVQGEGYNPEPLDNAISILVNDLNVLINGGVANTANENQTYTDGLQDLITVLSSLSDDQIANRLTTINNILFSLIGNETSTLSQQDITPLSLSAINIYVLAYNNQKQLVGNPHATALGTTDNLPLTLLGNVSNYLNNFKLMTDTVTINDGYVVNFGVFFDIIAEKYANKQKVKLDCIQKIKEYFRIEKMQFNQPIYKSNLEFELMGVEGVRSIGHVTITQDYDYFYQDAADNVNEGDQLEEFTYRYSYDNEGNFEDSSASGNGSENYGFKYDFKNALSDDKTIILPPNTDTPAVFELKFPNQNIQGRVR